MAISAVGGISGPVMCFDGEHVSRIREAGKLLVPHDVLEDRGGGLLSSLNRITRHESIRLMQKG